MRVKFGRDTIERWQNWADEWLLLHGRVNRMAIYEGSMAWRVAHRCGITDEAYSDRSVVDAHIVTALRQVFPNAVFKDTYRY